MKTDDKIVKTVLTNYIEQYIKKSSYSMIK